MINKNIVIGLLLGVGIASTTHAAVYNTSSKTSSFDVSTIVVADCSIAAYNLDFGQQQGIISADTNVSSNINVTCTNNTPYNIGLNAGTGAGSSGTTRFLSGTGTNTDTIRFNLYQSPGAGLWGNTQGTDTLGGTGNGSAQTISVYGVIPPQKSPQPDTYKSTITATVYF